MAGGRETDRYVDGHHIIKRMEQASRRKRTVRRAYQGERLFQEI